MSMRDWDALDWTKVAFMAVMAAALLAAALFPAAEPERDPVTYPSEMRQ